MSHSISFWIKTIPRVKQIVEVTKIKTFKETSNYTSRTVYVKVRFGIYYKIFDQVGNSILSIESPLLVNYLKSCILELGKKNENRS